MPSVLYIKNMVCVRCKMAVQTVLESMGLKWTQIELGWAEITSQLSNEEEVQLNERLRKFELELMHDKNAILIERIKTEIIRILHSEQLMQLKLSVHLSELLNYNYTYIANMFSESEGSTLERYFITQRIERVKELIVYEDMSLADIVETLRFSSISHLCVQFKKVTGYTPAEYRRMSRSEKFIWKT